MESVAKCEFCFTKEKGDKERGGGREREKWCWEDNYYPQGENYVKLNFLHIVSFQTQIINVLFIIVTENVVRRYFILKYKSGPDV